MILVDTGPLVAAADRSDTHYTTVVASFRSVKGPLGTTWPVITDAMFLLADVPGGQDMIWGFIERGYLRILELGKPDVLRLRELMAKYVDIGMELADASLVRIAERENLRRILTLDRRDFSVYRILGKSRFEIIPD